MTLMIYSMVMMFLSVMFLYLGLYLFLLKEDYVLEWVILSFKSLKFNYLVYLDYMCFQFMGIVLIISSVVMFYSMDYMKLDLYVNRFKYLVMLFIVSMCLMILSPSILSILLGWDGLGLISFCLVIYYQNFDSMNSGMLTVLCNRLGDVGLLMLIILYVSNGSWSSMLIMNKMNMVMIYMLLIMAITKSAQLPFCSWLIAAMTAPTPVSSLVHSSTLVTAGVYLLIRYNDFFMVNKNWLLWISSLTMLMSGLMANLEYDLKKIIALSTLSQLSFMMLILCLGYTELAFFHLIIHALFKSNMFLCAGDFIHSMMGNQDIRKYGGLIYIFPLKSFIMIMCLINLMGMPFTMGFYSKDIILEFFLNGKYNLLILVMNYISTFLTISYSIRLMQWILFFKFLSFNSYINLNSSKIMLISLVFMTILMIFYGWFFYNLYMIKLMMMMNMFNKLMILKLFIIGILMNYLMFDLLKFKEYKKIINFLMSMFYMNYIFKFSYMFVYKLIYKYELINEKGWLELMLGLYMYKMGYLFECNFKSMNMINLMEYYIYLFLILIIFL